MRASFPTTARACVALGLALAANCGDRLPARERERADALAYDGPGADVLGRPLAAPLPARSLGPRAEIAGHVTLVRWWTDACPFCETSLPALESLRTRYAARGLAAVAVFHPKPPHAVSDAEVLAAAERLGWHGNVRVDEDWSVLDRNWRAGHERAATSVTFLLDAHGVVRWVHPGPELHPSGDPAHAACAADFARLERALSALLDE